MSDQRGIMTTVSRLAQLTCALALAGQLSACQQAAPNPVGDTAARTDEAINGPAYTSSLESDPLDPAFSGWLAQPVWTWADLTANAPQSTAAVVSQRPVAPPPPDLWRNVNKRMLLDHHLGQKRVQQEIAWLQRNPNYLKRLQPRMQRYLPYIFEQTQLRNMPAEIALLPIVESALDPFAFSHGGASGPWQFVRGTARQYGLAINDWYDGRRDLIASTDAALDYLEALHRRFDDWYLALAGYNAGEGNVSKALRKNPGAGFFDLRLPRETQAYVPRLLALAEVIANPGAYGLELPIVEPDVRVATVETYSQFDLDKLSQTVGLSLDDIHQYNPALNQWATPPEGPHRIIVPTTVDLVAAQLAIDAMPSNQRVDWTEVTIRPGDSLSHIARRHGTDVASLKRANNLTSHRIRAGKKLLIPKSPQALSSVPRKSRGAQRTYVVRRGDSLWSISRKHDIAMSKLMRANDLGPKDTLSVGHEIVLPGLPDDKARSVVRKVRYKVRTGDSLSRIATKFKVSVQEIANWNNLDPNRYLQPGQGILLYVNVLGG
jgi:membrane-bound lytic murein transglycosylase D